MVRRISVFLLFLSAACGGKSKSPQAVFDNLDASLKKAGWQSTDLHSGTKHRWKEVARKGAYRNPNGKFFELAVLDEKGIAAIEDKDSPMSKSKPRKSEFWLADRLVVKVSAPGGSKDLALKTVGDILK